MTALLRRSMRGAFGRGVAGCAALAVGFTLNGCSLWNPHVTADMPQPQARFSTIEFAGNAAEGIDYANSWRTAYYDAVGDQAKLKNGIALVAIPAAATALYMGISGSSTRDVIAGLATGTAGLLGLGTYFESSDREKVYLAGSQAMGCIILASAPLLVPKGKFEQFQIDLDGTLPERDMTKSGAIEEQRKLRAESLAGAIDDTMEKAAQAELLAAELRAIKPEHPAVTDADTQLNAARQLISDSSATRGVADAFVIRILGAETEIVSRVETVRDKVSVEVVKTEPDIASITQITSGLSSAAGRIATIPPTKAVEKPAAQSVSNKSQSAGNPDVEQALNRITPQLAKAMDELRQSSGRLAAAAARIRAFLTAQDDRAKSAGKVGECGLNGLAIGVTIMPADTAVTLTAGQDYNIIISGGKRPYSAVLAGGHIPDGVTLTRSGFDQTPVVATISTDKDKSKAGGAFAVAISDASDSGGVLVNFTIPAPQGGKPDSGGGTPEPKKDSASDPKTPSQFEKDQLIGVDNDRALRIAMYGAGIRGAALKGDVTVATVRSEIVQFQKTKKLKATDGKFDEATYSAAVTEADSKPDDWKNLITGTGIACNIGDSQSAYECTGLSLNDFHKVQTKLGVAESDGFTEPMRDKLAAAAENTAKSRQLDLALVRALTGPAPQ